MVNTSHHNRPTSSPTKTSYPSGAKGANHMTNEPEQLHTSPFDATRQTTTEGGEYWSARDLAKLLGYAKWDKFKVAIERAKKACEQSGQGVTDHFLQAGNMVKIGSGAQRNREDYQLSRYACYLLVQSKTYFTHFISS